MSDMLEPLCAHTPTFEFYERALKLSAQNSLGFYDTLIIQAAMDLRCNILYSEDLQDNQRFGTLVVRNPFV
jgi:predicted nucleic acid-binding protein